MENFKFSPIFKNYRKFSCIFLYFLNLLGFLECSGKFKKIKKNTYKNPGNPGKILKNVLEFIRISLGFLCVFQENVCKTFCTFFAI